MLKICQTRVSTRLSLSEHKPNAVIRDRATRDRDKASIKTSANKPTWQGLLNAQAPIVEGLL